MNTFKYTALVSLFILMFACKKSNIKKLEATTWETDDGLNLLAFKTNKSFQSKGTGLMNWSIEAKGDYSNENLTIKSYKKTTLSSIISSSWASWRDTNVVISYKLSDDGKTLEIGNLKYLKK